MATVNRHNSRRGNIAPKGASRAARAAAFAAGERKAYTRADRVALLADTRTLTAAITSGV